jgi:hypothetical protein
VCVNESHSCLCAFSLFLCVSYMTCSYFFFSFLYIPIRYFQCLLSICTHTRAQTYHKHARSLSLARHTQRFTSWIMSNEKINFYMSTEIFLCESQAANVRMWTRIFHLFLSFPSFFFIFHHFSAKYFHATHFNSFVCVSHVIAFDYQTCVDTSERIDSGDYEITWAGD